MLRQRRGWIARDLAARCAALGASQLTHTVITNLETGRRDEGGRRRREVTVDELLILAAALDVPPPYLLTPLSGDAALEITPTLVLNAFGAVAWLSGEDMAAELEERGAEARAVFRRAKRPLNLLRHAWMCIGTLESLRSKGKAGTSDYETMLAELSRWLDELDGLGVALPPLPEWLTDDLVKAGN